MFYKKTSTNYKKWDFFIDSEDELENEDTDPIVPDDDPNFKAMEMDMRERQKARNRDKKEALILKDRGNECLKKSLFKSAHKYYSEAMDLKKDLLPLYTNRALCRIKMENWQGALDDTTKMMEYCELFEDGFTKSKDLCFKAFLRRCTAFRGMREYELALKDAEQALILCPTDKEAALFLKIT
jgi:tetratricopeptide (TPR) repeat protein